MNRRNKRSVASAIAAVALAMAAFPVSAQTKAQTAKAGANFLSPLKAAARAASRDLWGYMNNANAYPTASNQLGYMAFDAATASNFRDLKTEDSRTMSPNGGSSYYDGKYHAVHFSMSQETGKLVVTYYQFNTEDKWHSEFAPELVSDRRSSLQPPPPASSPARCTASSIPAICRRSSSASSTTTRWTAQR